VMVRSGFTRSTTFRYWTATIGRLEVSRLTELILARKIDVGGSASSVNLRLAPAYVVITDCATAKSEKVSPRAKSRRRGFSTGFLGSESNNYIPLFGGNRALPALENHERDVVVLRRCAGESIDLLQHLIYDRGRRLLAMRAQHVDHAVHAELLLVEV